MMMMLQVLKMVVRINLKDCYYDDDVVGVEDDGQDQPEGLLI